MDSFVPAKSKALHHFALPPLLKWSKEAQSSGSLTKRPRSMKSPPRQRSAASASPPRGSPPPRIPYPEIGWSSESEASRKGRDDATLSAVNEHQLKNWCGNSEEGKEMVVSDLEEGEIDESKSWNLRPRNVKKEAAKAVVEKAEGGTGKKEKCEVGVEKKKKLSICIALTKEEIEEDIFAITGNKASRRPKRRPKNVQKQLDAVFPGLWLLGITPETYKVSENSLKHG